MSEAKDTQIHFTQNVKWVIGIYGIRYVNRQYIPIVTATQLTLQWMMQLRPVNQGFNSWSNQTNQVFTMLWTNFQGLKDIHDLAVGHHTPGIRVECLTRWQCVLMHLPSILFNYEVQLDTWDKAVDVVTDTESKARINGVAAQMKSYDFVFGTTLRWTDLATFWQPYSLSLKENHICCCWSVSTKNGY